MKRHSFDPFSFLFGSVFLMIGVSFLLSPSGPQVATPIRLWPAALVLVGLTLSAWALARTIRPAAPASLQPAEAETIRATEELGPSIPIEVPGGGSPEDGTSGDGVFEDGEP